jgi:hypothetical protein
MPKFCRLERFSGGMSKQKKLSRLEKNKLAQQELDESLKKSLSGAEDVSDEKKLLEDKLKKSSWGLSEACFIAICGYPLGGWGHWNYRLNELESLAYQIFKDNAALKDSAEIYVIDFNVDIGDIYKQAYLAAKEGVFGAVHGLPLLWDVDPSKFIAWVLHLKNSENQPYVFHPSFIDWAKRPARFKAQSRSCLAVKKTLFIIWMNTICVLLRACAAILGKRRSYACSIGGSETDILYLQTKHLKNRLL